MRHAFLAAGAVLAVSGCGPSGATFPDGNDVKAAQTAWCNALAKGSGGDAWPELDKCRGAFPSSSGPYLRAMTVCFTARREGKTDLGAVVADCNEEVLVKVSREPGEEAAKPLVEARCARTSRCEKLGGGECKKSFESLEASQRALLTTAYNAGARARIGECLTSASCAEDEEKARETCYKPESDKLVWLP